MKAPTRPVVRYFGGKWRLAPWIISHMGPHRVYVEPYGGSFSVGMQKPRVYAEIYNELDGEMVNLFRVLRDPAMGTELQRRIGLTAYARAEFEMAYEPCDPADLIERARRTVVKAYMGFGSNAIQVGSPSGRGFRGRISTTRQKLERGKTGFRTTISTHPRELHEPSEAALADVYNTGFRTAPRVRRRITRPQTGFRARAFASGSTPAIGARTSTRWRRSSNACAAL